MKKKVLFTLSLSFLICSVYSQVGINIDKPLGIFHIDGNGDTKSLDTATTDDFIIKSDGNGGIVTALGGDVDSAASLALRDTNKALQLNKVALNSSVGSDTSNPIQNPAEGMLVFNINVSGTFPDNVVPDPYVFSNGYWRQLTYVADNTGLGDYELNSDDTPIPYLSNTTYSQADFLAKGKKLNFINPETGDTSDEILLTSNAAYSVALQFNGATTNTGRWTLAYIYVAAVDYTDIQNPKVLDVALITPVIGANSSITTYATILGFNGNLGDKVKIIVCQQLQSALTWTLDNTSRVIVWRL